MAFGARSQSSKTYLERHFEGFPSCKPIILFKRVSWLSKPRQTRSSYIAICHLLKDAPVARVLVATQDHDRLYPIISTSHKFSHEVSGPVSKGGSTLRSFAH